MCLSSREIDLLLLVNRAAMRPAACRSSLVRLAGVESMLDLELGLENVLTDGDGGIMVVGPDSSNE